MRILSVEIKGKVVIIKTSPQTSFNYYLLKFKDTASIIFSSVKGDRLVDDAVSRELFFVGIKSVNKIRDRIYSKIPSIIDVDNSLIIFELLEDGWPNKHIVVLKNIGLIGTLHSPFVLVDRKLSLSKWSKKILRTGKVLLYTENQFGPKNED